jgi:hypothetical protein
VVGIEQDRVHIGNWELVDSIVPRVLHHAGIRLPMNDGNAPTEPDSHLSRDLSRGRPEMIASLKCAAHRLLEAVRWAGENLEAT